MHAEINSREVDLQDEGCCPQEGNRAHQPAPPLSDDITGGEAIQRGPRGRAAENSLAPARVDDLRPVISVEEACALCSHLEELHTGEGVTFPPHGDTLPLLLLRRRRALRDHGATLSDRELLAGQLGSLQRRCPLRPQETCCLQSATT